MSFRMRRTIRFGDVDSAGIVYYPRYLHFCHVAMEEYFREVLGMPYPTLLRNDRLGFPAVSLAVQFHRPLRYGDEVEVEAAIERVGETSLAWRFRFVAPGSEQVLSQANVVTVGLNLDTFEKQRVPEWLRQRAAASSAPR